MPVDLGEPEPATTSDDSAIKFVVGIGASAGGLKSIERLFRALPIGTCSSFVVIQHLSPDAESSMEDILKRYTDMSVITVEDGMRLEPDKIFLIPPGKEIELEGSRFTMSPLDREQIGRPVDTFFHSLAGSYGALSIGVILSGTGSDGVEGVKAIHEAGGTTIVESLDTAQFDGMPRNAIATDMVDMVLSPEEISLWLSYQFETPSVRPDPIGDVVKSELTGISLIFSLLAERHEIEFSFYKPATVARRIERRRMMSRQSSILDYAEFVKGNVEELDFLYHDLLIGVTKFFRDTEAFSRLESLVNERIADLPEDEEFRIWCAGCATGEEAYSLAMLCHEGFEKVGREPRFKIFATDAHGGSLESASRGVYRASSMEYVGNERQKKYFTQDSKDQFRVSAELRRNLVFARHNVVEDPPFTKIDLVTCRNLLIYLQTKAQLQAISAFHFALKVDSLMMLGSSESPGQLAEEFSVVDDSWKIYQKIRNLPGLTKPSLDLPPSLSTRPRRLVNLLNNDQPETLSFTGLLDGYDLILREFISSGIMLDDKRNVLHVFGDANKYLHSSSGRFTGSIVDFMLGETKTAMAAALIRAESEIGKQIVLEGLRLPLSNGDQDIVDVRVKALPGHSSGAFIWFVAFQPSDSVSPDNDAERENIKVTLASDAYTAMESELLYTKESLNATVEEVETSNEELQAANEQLLAAIEELQSTNEELHSVNEELYSVNAENQRKIVALEEMTDDVDNLLASTDVGTVFLDAEMQIRKFTNAASKYIKLQPGDVGRHITDFATHVICPDLYDKIEGVIAGSKPYSENVCEKTKTKTTSTSTSTSRVLVRVMPYLSHGKIKGAIVNFIELNENRFGEGVSDA
jgi:two-component system CheB/CheR fusion protein